VLGLRFVQGAIGAGFYIAAVAAATDLAPPERRASAIARLSVAMYVGFAVGPAAGEWLLDQGPGIAWTTLALVCALGGLVTWSLPETRRPDADAVPGALFHRSAWLPGVAMLTLGIGYTSITALSALNARRLGLDDSTPLYVTFAGSVLLVRLGSGRLADRVGAVPVVNAGIVSFAVGFVGIALGTTPAPVLVGIALAGAGWALLLPAQSAWLASRVPDGERGAALGSLVAIMDVGQATGGLLVGAVADHLGFGWAYAVPAALAVVAFGVTQAVPRPVMPTVAVGSGASGVLDE
jgi:MFS family permease